MRTIVTVALELWVKYEVASWSLHFHSLRTDYYRCSTVRLMRTMGIQCPMRQWWWWMATGFTSGPETRMCDMYILESRSIYLKLTLAD